MGLRKLILHAGPHKTGTCSLQAIFRYYPFKSFYYPKIGQWPDGAHHNLVFNLVPELLRPDAEILSQDELLLGLRTELEEAPQDTLLISSEFLSTGCAGQIFNWLVENSFVDKSQARGLLVERDILSRAASLYNQSVKDPYIGETRGPDQWLEEEIDTIGIEPMVANLESAGINVEVIPYAPSESLVKRVLMAAGAEEEEIPQEIPWANPSMSEQILMALLEVNRTEPDPIERIRHRTRLFEEIQPAFVLSSPNLFACAREEEQE